MKYINRYPKDITIVDINCTIHSIDKGKGKGEFGRAREKEKKRNAGVPLLPRPSRVVSRPNSLPLPFRTPASQAIR